MTDEQELTRRRALQAVGAGVGVAGVTTAASGRERSRIVGLKPGVEASLATDRAVEVTSQFDFGDIGSAVVGRFERGDIRELADHHGVRYIEENGRMEAHRGDESGGGATPDGEVVPYGIELTGADEAVAEGATGEGVTVAIVDTGIDPTHETLSENVVGGWASDEAACTDDCEEPWDDDDEHGTHVAGTAAAQLNDTGVYGVAPEADLLAVKVLDSAGVGSYEGITDGMLWAADSGADVVNMSLGGDDSELVDDAVEYVTDSGAVLVSSAGNAGPCSDCVSTPANHPDAIAVSATDESDTLAGFSSTGPEIDIAAPGVDVLSTVPDPGFDGPWEGSELGDNYDTLSGTSMSSPHVAGATAALLGAGVPATEVGSALTEGAVDVGLDDNEQGSGRLDVPGAIEAGDGDPGESPFDPVDVTTDSASNVGETSATLNGSLNHLAEWDEATVWFEYGPAGSGLPETVEAGTAEPGESFSATVGGLSAGTSYEFLAVAAAGDGEKTGDGFTMSFETHSDGGFCFITTATAGETETLDSLRRFRDDSMTTTPVGKGLVGLYYRISPPIARTLDRHPDSPEASATRAVIDASAGLSDAQAETESHIANATLGVALTMLYLVGLVTGALGHASLRAREMFGVVR